MSASSRDRWNEVSPYLDQALDLPKEERASWLAALREREPVIAARVETLLVEHSIPG